MKLRNFANKFLLVVLILIVGWGQTGGACVVTSLSPLAEAQAYTKTYYFDQFNHNNPTEQSLYQALGIPAYNDYLATVQAGQGLEEIVIAVLDSGLNPAHPVFENRIVTQHAIDLSHGVSTENKEFYDDWSHDHKGHGTHVAGIIADMTLPNVKILPIKMFHDFENESSSYAFENAVRYITALKNGTKQRLFGEDGKLTTDEFNAECVKLNIVAVNLSLGTDGYNVKNANSMRMFNKLKYGEKNNGYQSVIDRLLRADILPIVAAGNYNSEYEKISQPAYYSLPGACDGVLAVAAYDNTLIKYQRARFSYYNNFVGVSAPGEEIWSACSQDIFNLFTNAELGSEVGKFGKVELVNDGEYKIFYDYKFLKSNNQIGKSTWVVRQDEYGNWCYRTNGTSMAAPFASACYAMLVSDTSKKTAEDFGLSSWDNSEGGADEYFMNPSHKALLAAAATYGDQGNKGYDVHFGYGVLSMQAFATADVAPLQAVKYEIKPSTTMEETADDADWYYVCVVIFIGGILVWGFGYFKSYFTGRKINDSEPQ